MKKALIGVCVLLMVGMVSFGCKKEKEPVSPPPAPTMDEIKDKANDAADKAKEAVDDAADATEEAVENAAEKVEEATK